MSSQVTVDEAHNPIKDPNSQTYTSLVSYCASKTTWNCCNINIAYMGSQILPHPK
jgi:hypothetical protein